MFGNGVRAAQVAMPRGARLDVAGALYHAIARGVVRRPIFRSDEDRRDFLRRLEFLVGAEDISVCAYVLMDAHSHLVVRRGATALGQFTRRLLTVYSVAFNRRRWRGGH